VAAAEEYQRSGLGGHPEELARQVQLAADLGSEFAGCEDRFFDFLSPHRSAGDLILEEWMWNLANRLGKADMVEEAVAVSEIFARLDPHDAWNHRCNAAVVLAQAGRAEEARRRVQTNLTDYPDRHLVMIRSAHAAAAYGDLATAKSLWQALELAEEGGDPEEVDAAREWFEHFFDDHGPDDADRAVLTERVADWHRRTGWVTANARLGQDGGPGLTRPAPVRAGPKVGRNQPCPCGSGRKYKRCCGRP